MISILRNCIAVWSAFDLTDKGNNAGALSLSLNHRTDYDHWFAVVRSEGLTIAKALVHGRAGKAVSSANRIYLFYLPPADNLFIDGQTVCSDSHAVIVVLHGSY